MMWATSNSFESVARRYLHAPSEMGGTQHQIGHRLVDWSAHFYPADPGQNPTCINLYACYHKNVGKLYMN
jgi:hypothetical protein